MNNPTDFDLTLRAVLLKVPFSDPSSTATIEALLKYMMQLDTIASSEYEQRGRCRLVDRAQVELIEQLEALYDTEQPDAEELPPASSSSSPAPATDSRAREEVQ